MEEALPDIGELAGSFDVHCPALAEPVHEVLSVMRDEGGVNWSTAYGGFWVLTSYDAIFKAAQDWQHFSNAFGISPSHDRGGYKFVPIEYDPPVHRAWRRVLNPVFSPQEAAILEVDIRAIADRLIDSFVESGSASILDQYVRPLQGDVFFKLIFGLPDEEVALCRKAATDGVFAIDPQDRQAGFMTVREHCKLIYEERFDREKTSTVIAALNQASIDGEAVTEDDYRGVLELLIFGGNETTANALGNILLHLATHPNDRDRGVGDPSAVSSVIEESLRHESPVVWNGRTVVEDFVFEGHEMKAGQKVQLSWMSAGRDETVYSDAAEFDPDRGKNHLSFGAGPHRCLGSHLARVILNAGTSQLLMRIPDFRMTDNAAIQHNIGDSRGLVELPLIFTPGSRTA